MSELIAVKLLLSLAGSLLAHLVAGWKHRRRAERWGHMD